MTITQFGTVTITEDDIIVSRFAFDGSGTSEAVAWAIKKLQDVPTLTYRIGETFADTKPSMSE